MTANLRVKYEEQSSADVGLTGGAVASVGENKISICKCCAFRVQILVVEEEVEMGAVSPLGVSGRCSLVVMEKDTRGRVTFEDSKCFEELCLCILCYGA